MMTRYVILSVCVLGMTSLSGCGGGGDETAPEPANTSQTPAETSPQLTPVSKVDDPAADVASPMQSDASPIPSIPSISLSGSSTTNSTTETIDDPIKKATAADEKRRKLLEVMKPVQIMLGSWNGTTQKEVGDFKALTTPAWVWDFKTNREQPAMVMTSEKSPYLKNARLSYLTDDKKFIMSATDDEGNVREFEGTFSKPVEEFQGDDQKMHVKYQLQLKQTNGTSPRNTWQVTFNQQENHRYLVELARKSGSNFLRFDTIATQRAGTSFAKSDLGYGERECIISGGLGTSQVSHNGKSYWVCCSGCKAAFDEDPESWIAEYQAKVAAKEGS
ncbi:MAG: hypothetical protein HON04_10915 [Planctomicrobium sp.]|jgi:hypothetical protein|nr:hypothetical protein [Planctomicrobium sp.]